MNRTMLAAAASLAMFGSLELRASAESPQAPTFTPPGRPLIVTRTVVRTLQDGNAIVARRSYRITFEPDGEDFAVSRTLISSEISAPLALQAIAELERRRTEPQSMTMVVDRHGIARVRSPAPPAQPLQVGVDLARELISDTAVEPSDKRDADTFVSQTAAHGVPVPWPADLFSPAAVDFDDSRAVALGGGASGTVSVAHRIKARLPNGAPAAFEREIVTEIAGSRQVSHEEWTIGEQSGP